jgi:Tol biopolymer transport system component/imidazolonepropionase-like amidohydrolase
MTPTPRAAAAPPFRRIALYSLLLLWFAPAPALAQEDEADEPPVEEAADTTEAEDDDWTPDIDLGPSRTLSFTVSEGTWMNLDLSPDGGTIVFDLLGDLYTLPIEGGQATRITSGAAYDMHPRFSPRGDRIVFSSDRDGSLNLWLVDADGSNPTQVSEETDREVNSTAWSADGDYIFTRKHFVDTRSLGAGEVWMYHRSGGKGLQVTERTSWQKDQGEPFASPDGQYLYFSQDDTPGQNFQYNKDPYAGIYQVHRRDLVTGETETVAGGPGGAHTPAISPDGRYLSFLRRDRVETVLYLRDLATGEEWPLFDHLDRDMQEIWAIHGVYPQYDWTPDSRRIVIWGEGKIWSVDVGTGEYTEIPLTADVEHVVHEALRFPVDVSPERFRVKMLRNVTTSPNGGRAAYDALGSVYVKDMPGGAPRRLTSADRIEFDPAFSPDGRRIAMATWTDAGGGRIVVLDAGGGGERVAVSERGHYTEPSWSPDGRWIVDRKAGGDSERGPAFGEETGIYVVPADGSAAPRMVRDNGSEPLFDHTGERIYVSAGGGGSTRLVSTDLNGGDEVVHFESDNATQIVPSPDGQWVAFTERYKAYVAAFPRTGRTVTLGPSITAFPVTQISRDAGINLHWSGDGSAVHWSLGPEYFTRELERSFAFLQDEGVGEPEADDPVETGVDISFDADTDVPTGTVAFTGARIITMAGRGWDGGVAGGAAAAGGTPEVIENGTIVVERNRISAVGSAEDVQVPAGAHVVDASGKTIMPGLSDVHAHVGSEGSGILAQQAWPLMANLAFGVTTSHDPSNNTEMVFTNSEMGKAGLKLGPRLFSTGTILYGAETPFKTIVKSLEDAEAHLRRMKAVGAFSVKSYNQRRRDARQWIIQAARELEMMVVPEGGALLFNNMSMVLDGHTSVEHSLPTGDNYDDVKRLFAESTTAYVPTLIVGYGGLWGENFWYERTNVWEDEHLLSFTPRGIIDARSRRRVLAAGDEDFNHIDLSEDAADMTRMGGLVALGAHGQVQGLGAHWELWNMEQGGLDAMEALAVGTINGARMLGMDADLGTLEPGKLADLVVLTANPLDDIRNSRTVELVMRNGRLYDAATLEEIGNHSSPAPTMYWTLLRDLRQE